jgi:NitT/TauT family transport system substrate-binding protein
MSMCKPVKLTVLALTIVFVSAWTASAQSPSLQTVKIRLDWNSGGYHAPFYLGVERGYYKREGIDLQIISGSGSSDTVKQVGFGTVGCGLADALVVVQGVRQQVPVKAIAAYFQQTPISVISPKDKPVVVPKQLLDGVKLGIKKGSATYQGLVALLAANKIPIEKLRLIDVGLGVAPLLIKRVDAIMGFSIDEPVSAEAGGMQVHVLSIAKFGVNTYGLALICNTELMKKNPALVKGFLKATRRAMSETAKNPAVAIAALSKALPELDAKREAEVLARAIPLWYSDETRRHNLGWQTEDRWDSTIDVAYDLGLIDTKLNSADVFTDAFLQSSAVSK